MAIEELTVDFPCPDCQQKFKVSLNQLLEGGVMVCPRCRANNAEAELEAIEQTLEFLGNSLQNIKKCIQDNAQLNR